MRERHHRHTTRACRLWSRSSLVAQQATRASCPLLCKHTVICKPTSVCGRSCGRSFVRASLANDHYDTGAAYVITMGIAVQKDGA